MYLANSEHSETAVTSILAVDSTDGEFFDRSVGKLVQKN